jgi:hypothetical protein
VESKPNLPKLYDSLKAKRRQQFVESTRVMLPHDPTMMEKLIAEQDAWGRGATTVTAIR